jgi:anaerobic magnesium-protoporphyrin IX monomethyl ester cyclase
MKVILVVPTHNYRDYYPSFLSFSDFPTGFGYLASALKKGGHEVVGVNPNNITGYVNQKVMLTSTLTKALKDNPDAGLIGLGGLCTDYAFLKDAINIIRSNSSLPIALGGQIVTNDAEFIYTDLKPDYAVIGEAEATIVSIANGQISKGIVKANYKENLDKVAFPDYEPFGVQDMMDNYSDVTRVLYRYMKEYPRVWGIVTARSCPFSCTFCIHGKRDVPYRARSIPNVMEEIRETYKKYKYNILLILDELFATNKERMVEFCNGILEGKEKYGWDFVWTFQTHASSKLDLPTLQLARKAGCYMFSYGIESASPTVLKSMNKKIEVPQIIEAIKLAKEAKLNISGNLIFGDPAETDETISESLNFWLTYCRDCCVFLSDVRPYPGSKLFENMQLDKKQYYENIDKSVYNMTKIDNRDYSNRLTFINLLEKSWLMCRSVATDNWVEDVNGVDSPLTPFYGKAYKVNFTCPTCGAKNTFRQRVTHMNKSFYLGTSCTECQGKVRVDVIV